MLFDCFMVGFVLGLFVLLIRILILFFFCIDVISLLIDNLLVRLMWMGWIFEFVGIVLILWVVVKMKVFFVVSVCMMVVLRLWLVFRMRVFFLEMFRFISLGFLVCVFVV